MEWNSIAGTVATQIANYGADVTISRAIKGTFNDAAGTFTGDSVATYPVKALINAKGKRGYGEDREPGTLIRSASISFLVAANSLSITPLAGDLVTLANGTVFTVEQNIPVFPGGVYLMHRLLCRA
jgi:hypothetical protein